MQLSYEKEFVIMDLFVYCKYSFFTNYLSSG